MAPVAQTISAIVQANVVNELEGQFGQGGNHYPLVLHLGSEPALQVAVGESTALNAR